MLLALGFCDLDQVVIGKARRFLQDGRGDADLVVLGELADHRWRRLRDRRQLGADFRQRHAGADVGDGAQLDGLDQPFEHMVEQVDLLTAELARGNQKKVGDAPRGLDAFRSRASADRSLYFIDDRLPAGWHVLVLSR